MSTALLIWFSGCTPVMVGTGLATTGASPRYPFCIRVQKYSGFGASWRSKIPGVVLGGMR